MMVVKEWTNSHCFFFFLELHRKPGTSGFGKNGAVAHVPAVRDKREASGHYGRLLGGRLDERRDAKDVDLALEQVLPTVEGGATCGRLLVEESAREGLVGPEVLPRRD